MFWRTLLCAPLFAPFLFRKGWKELDRSDWLRMAAVGTLGYAAPLWIGTIGQNLSSAANASLLVGVEPVSIVLLSSVFLDEPLTSLKLGSIACGLAGAVLIVTQGGLRSLTPNFTGDLILFLHGFLWSLYTVIGKPVLKKADPMMFSAWTTLFGLIPIALLAGPAAIRLGWPSHFPYGSMAFITLFVSFGGVAAWNKALELVPASQLANFIFLQPLLGVALAAALQGESLTSWSFAGGALILASVYGASKE